MPRNTTTTPTEPHGSRSMILQPEDIVPLTAEEGAADIENAMRAFIRENHNRNEPNQRRRSPAPHLLRSRG